MSRILDNLTPAWEFRPRTTDEYAALQLARSFGDVARAKECADLIRRFGLEMVCSSLAKTAFGTPKNPDWSAVEQRLEEERGRFAPPRFERRLCAVKIERREVAAAVFSGLRLELLDTRHLPTDERKAERSALGFVHWIVANLDADSAALEVVTGNRTRRTTLTMALRASLRKEGVGLWDVPKAALLSSFAEPAPKTRRGKNRLAKEIISLVRRLYVIWLFYLRVQLLVDK